MRSESYTYLNVLHYAKSVTTSTPITYTWDMDSSLPVVLQDGLTTYVYGLGLISQTHGSGNQTNPLGDGLGSTTTLTDESLG